MDDHCLLDFLGDELQCSASGNIEWDDELDELLLNLPLPSMPVASESAVLKADERNMQNGINVVGEWLLSTRVEPGDPSFESTIQPLSRQCSTSSQNTVVSEPHCSTIVESGDFSFEGVLPSLSRQCSTSSQNSLFNTPIEMDLIDSVRLPPAEVLPLHVSEDALPPAEDALPLPSTEVSSMQEVLSLLPSPLELKKNWCGQDFTYPSPEFPVTPIVIPQVSREFFMEGVPSLERRRKIERYLQKRRRRIERQKLKKTKSSKMYPARSNVANKRVRVGGRFVCSSEWGKRIRPC